VLRDHMNEMSKFGRGNLKQSTRDPDFNPFTPYTSTFEIDPTASSERVNNPAQFYDQCTENPSSDRPEACG
jgi:hypothetical protein